MKSKKTFLIVLAFALLSWIAFFILVWRFNTAMALITELAQEEQLESRKDASVSLIERTVEELADEQAILESYLVTEDTVVDFIQSIESVAQDGGVDLDVNLVNFEGVKAPGEQTADEEADQILQIQMVSLGNWVDTFQFIALVENMPYSIQFERASLQLQETQLEGGEGALIEWRGDYELHVITRN